MLVGSTSGEIHTGLHSSPIPPRGEMPFHATDNSTEEMSEHSGSQNIRKSRNAYPLTRRRRADWLDLLSSRLSAFCVQQGQEPQREVAVEASES